MLGRKISGQADSPELEELERLMQQKKELAQFYKSLFAEKVSATDAEMLTAEQAYATHFVKMQIGRQFDDRDNGQPPVVKINKRRKILYIAAAAAVLITGSILFSRLLTENRRPPQASKTGNSTNEIVTRKGSKTSIRLPDGTQVWLNGDSKISYMDNFQGATREVQLTGEAFFDVVKDQTRPFIIHTQTVDVKVLGTAFNVRSYPGERKTETALIRGLVEVTVRNKPGKIIIRPNEKLSVDNETVTGKTGKAAINTDRITPGIKIEKLAVLPVDSNLAATAWVNNKLAFDNEPFEEVAFKLERWYNVTVVIKEESLKKLRFSGVFENEALPEVMEALRLTTGRFSYQIKDAQVTVYSK